MMLYKLGPLVIQPISLKPKTATFELNHIAEIEEPWRYGRCLIIRYWRGKGLLIGWWTGRHEDEDSALILAINGRPDELLDEDGKLQERYEREPEPGYDDDDWEIYEVKDASEVWR